MALDGYSNIRNEPIKYASLTKNDGDTTLMKTIDTSGNVHSSQYLLELVNEAIKACKEEFKSNVVTDNATNVIKMRKQLAEYRSLRNLLWVWGSYSELVSKGSRDC